MNARPRAEILRQSARSGWLRRFRLLGRVAAAAWPYPWPIEVEQRTFYVDLRSGIGRGLVMTGDFDPEVWACLRRTLGKGGVLVDVGANTGWYSFHAAQIVRPNGRVVAVEADPRALRCLSATLGRNADLPIVVVRAAASDRDGVGFLSLARDCGHSALTSSGRGHPTRTVTLDSLLSELRLARVDALKIDVEGAELRVLEGATRLIQEHHPIVVCEASETTLQQFNARPTDLVAFLRALDYSVTTVPGAWTATILGQSPR